MGGIISGRWSPSYHGSVCLPDSGNEGNDDDDIVLAQGTALLTQVMFIMMLVHKSYNSSPSCGRGN